MIGRVVVFRGFQGSQSAPRVRPGDFGLLARRVGSGRETFEISRVGSRDFPMPKSGRVFLVQPDPRGVRRLVECLTFLRILQPDY